MPKCPLCPKTHQSPNDLDDHLKKIHGTTLEEINRKDMTIGDFLRK